MELILDLPNLHDFKVLNFLKNLVQNKQIFQYKDQKKNFTVSEALIHRLYMMIIPITKFIRKNLARKSSDIDLKEELICECFWNRCFRERNCWIFKIRLKYFLKNFPSNNPLEFFSYIYLKTSLKEYNHKHSVSYFHHGKSNS